METDNADVIWDGGFPYDILAEAGITPASSIDEVRQAIFYYMEKDRDLVEEIRPAWDQLRQITPRLYIDFYLCRQDWPAEEESDDA